MISYEVDCDPYTKDCFIGCTDKACTEEYFYHTITRPADDIKAACGTDITNCDAAQHCGTNDTRCVFTTCDSRSTECDLLDTRDNSDSVQKVNNYTP